jgi:transposase
MGEQTVRKTYKYKLKPTSEQERAMAFVLRRCRELYNAALEERRDAWQKCGVNVTEAMQSAQLPDIKEVRPGIPRHSLPGLAGRAHAARQSLSSLLPARQER